MPSVDKNVLRRYRYDPLDYLIGLKSSVQDEELQRFYCKSRLATEIQGMVRYSIVQQGDQLLAQQKCLGDTPETALLVTDQQGSVTHTVGGYSLPIVYSPYGHRRAESGLTSVLGFNGERPDTITGHYLLGNGHRAFNPAIMRFNSPDRLSPFGRGGINAYAYCSGDPVNRRDPTGGFSFPWMWKAGRIDSSVFTFISNRTQQMSRYGSPWYTWTSIDLDVAKLQSGRSSPFTEIHFDRKALFRSSNPFSRDKPQAPPQFSQPMKLKHMSRDKVPPEVWLEQPAPIKKLNVGVDPDIVKHYSRMRMNPESFAYNKIFTDSPGSKNFSDHADRFGAVMKDIVDAFEYRVSLGSDRNLSPRFINDNMKGIRQWGKL